MTYPCCIFTWYRICYERVKFVNPVFATFFMSAWWHGFYPAYYFLFVMIAMDIMAARKVNLLFIFQGGKLLGFYLLLDKTGIAASLSIKSGHQVGL